MAKITEDISYQVMYQACSVVAQSMGIRLSHPVSAPTIRDRRDFLDAIINASGLRYREIHLKDDWWKRDIGPFLGFIKGDDYPVALIPVSAGKYKIVDAGQGMRKPLTQAMAARLDPVGISIYRPFPARPMNPIEVFRFGMQDSAADIFNLLTMGIISGLLGLAAPIMTGWLISTVIPSAALDQHLQICIGLVFAAIGASVFQLVQGIATLRIQGKSTVTLQAALWERLISLPANFFRGSSAGEIVEKGMAMENIQQMLSGQLLHLMMRVAFSLFNLALLFYYSVWLALCAVLLVAAVAVVSIFISFKEMKIQREAVATRYKLSGLVLQMITGISKLRVAGAEKRAFANWSHFFTQMRHARFRGKMLRNLLNGFTGAVPTAATIMMFMAMGFPKIQEALPLGDFIAFHTAFGQFVAAAVALSVSLAPLFMILPVYEQANVILKTPPEYGLHKKDAGVLQGAIELHGLTFGYGPNAPAVIKGVSFKVEPGEFVAVIGPSGSGKSTLLRLLLGFEQANSGSIFYDNKPLSMLDIGSVRRQFGVVLQDGQVMQGTVFNNIIGASRRILDEAWEAARLAGIEQDIREMPMQMHTVIPQGGGTLSGGQRQRLQIARALVNKPRILFFDEATSALDNNTQKAVQDSLDKLTATRIVIAHRLSTVKNADRILVLVDGRIVEQGKYTELMQNKGVFSDLAERQIA